MSRLRQDIKAAIINIFKELQENMLKKLKVQGRLGGSVSEAPAQSRSQDPGSSPVSGSLLSSERACFSLSLRSPCLCVLSLPDKYFLKINK